MLRVLVYVCDFFEQCYYYKYDTREFILLSGFLGELYGFLSEEVQVKMKVDI